MARTWTFAGFTYTNSGGEIEIVGYNQSAEKHVSIPSTISGSFLRLFSKSGTVRSIGKGAFRGCGIRSVILPDSLESIADEAFAQNDLVQVILPSNLKLLGKGAFRDNKLEVVEIKSSTTIVAEGAFAGNPNLTYPSSDREILGETETERGQEMKPLQEQPAMQSDREEDLDSVCEETDDHVTITGVSGGVCATPKTPAKVAEKDNWRLQLNDDGTYTVCGYRGEDTSISIPKYIGKKRVTRIGEGAFSPKKKGARQKERDVYHNLVSAFIPEGVTDIGKNAFEGCGLLDSVVIEDGANSVGSGAFKGCEFLTTVSIGEGLKHIGDRAFEGCARLSFFAIPNSVSSIGKGAFYDCRDLTSITIPECVTVISAKTFSGCRSLTSVTIPASITSIGEDAFARCLRLASVAIPSSVGSIGEGAFSGCGGLTTVAIPGGVDSIGRNAFSGCHSLVSVIIAEGVRSIGSSAFKGCQSLAFVVVPEGVTSLESYVFDDCSSPFTVVIPNSVQTIDRDAFGARFSYTGFFYVYKREKFVPPSRSLIILGKLGSVAEAYVLETDVRLAAVTRIRFLQYSGEEMHPVATHDLPLAVTMKDTSGGAVVSSEHPGQESQSPMEAAPVTGIKVLAKSKASSASKTTTSVSGPSDAPATVTSIEAATTPLRPLIDSDKASIDYTGEDQELDLNWMDDSEDEDTFEKPKLKSLYKWGLGHTAPGGRASRHEAMRVGDKVHLVRDLQNDFSDSAIEVFNLHGESIGYLSNVPPKKPWGVDLEVLAKAIDNGSASVIEAKVIESTPRSKLGSRQAYPLMTIEIRLQLAKAETRKISRKPGSHSHASKAKPHSGKGGIDLEVKTNSVPVFEMIQVGDANRSYEFPTGDDDSTTGTAMGGYLLSSTEVTYELWYAVLIWATDRARGDKVYAFQNRGMQGRRADLADWVEAMDHLGKDYTRGKNLATLLEFCMFEEGSEPSVRRKEPVTSINWRDAVIWLNALSELEGRSPVYRTRDNSIMRDSTSRAQGHNVEDLIDASKIGLNNGYRLPTSAEWEMAARWQDAPNGNGSSIHVAGRYWTPGNYASGATGGSDDEEDRHPARSKLFLSAIDGDAVAQVAVFWDHDDDAIVSGLTSDVKSKKPNALGLWDMSGNVAEWCFDAWGQDGSQRVYRGGCCADYGDSKYEMGVGFVTATIPDYVEEVDGEGPILGLRIAQATT